MWKSGKHLLNTKTWNNKKNALNAKDGMAQKHDIY